MPRGALLRRSGYPPACVSRSAAASPFTSTRWPPAFSGSAKERRICLPSAMQTFRRGVPARGDGARSLFDAGDHRLRHADDLGELDLSHARLSPHGSHRERDLVNDLSLLVVVANSGKACAFAEFLAFPLQRSPDLAAGERGQTTRLTVKGY